MTDEELAGLMQEISEQIEQLPEDAEKPLSKDETKRKVLLQARKEALNRIKSARENGSVHQEVKSGIDYALLTEYGDRHWLLFNYMKSRMTLFGF